MQSQRRRVAAVATASSAAASSAAARTASSSGPQYSLLRHPALCAALSLLMPGSRSGVVIRCVAAGLALVALGVAIGLAWPYSGGTSVAPSADADRLSRCLSVDVPRVHLAGAATDASSGDAELDSLSRLSYAQLARLRRPLILTGDALLTRRWSSWARGGVLDPASIVDRFPTLPVYVRSSEQGGAFATFHEHKPLERASGLDRASFNSRRTVDSRCVLRGDHEGDEGDEGAEDEPHCGQEWSYFSMRLSRLPEDFMQSVQPHDELILSNNSQANLWLGRRGLSTAAHFDLQFNFFAQMEGTKTFSLFAPGEGLKLYPNTHPHQAHVWPTPSARAESDAAGEECRSFALGGERITRHVARLGRGDMLLVPPLWVHHVRTDSRSVSVNVWSDAPEYEDMQRVYALPIPLESDWTLPDRVSSTLYFLRRLVLAVTQSGETGLQRSEGAQAEKFKTRLFRQWIERWLTGQRFHKGILSSLLSNSMTSDTPEADLAASANREILSQACAGGLGAASKRAVSQWQTEEHEARWKRGLAPIVELFRHIRIVAQPIDSRPAVAQDPAPAAASGSASANAITSLLLANYVEWILVAMLGEDAMLGFIGECLSEAKTRGI